MTEERVAPLFTIRDHVEARGLLQTHRGVDGVILGTLVDARGEPTGFETLPRLDQRRWTQQASDHVAPDRHDKECMISRPRPHGKQTGRRLPRHGAAVYALPVTLER